VAWGSELSKWHAAALVFPASTIVPAEALLWFRGTFSDLVLPGSLSLSEASASALASVRGHLTLSVNDICFDVACALACHEDEMSLTLRGPCSPASIAELAAHRGNELVLHLDEPPSDELHAVTSSNTNAVMARDQSDSVSNWDGDVLQFAKRHIPK